MKIKFFDINDAYFFSDTGDYDDNLSYMCLQTGKFYFKSDYVDDEEPIPDDIDDYKKYILIPHRDELNLAHPGEFVAEKMPEHMDHLNEIFSYKGAYRRFKDWLIQIDRIDDWYEYENKKTEIALRNWCKENNIALED